MVLVFFHAYLSDINKINMRLRVRSKSLRYHFFLSLWKSRREHKNYKLLCTDRMAISTRKEQFCWN